MKSLYLQVLVAIVLGAAIGNAVATIVVSRRDGGPDRDQLWRALRPARDGALPGGTP
jgi:uncharacterized membrane protein YccC